MIFRRLPRAPGPPASSRWRRPRCATPATATLFTERVRRELGIDIDIIGGLKEARYGFAGAVRGVAASSGLLFDLGGGSVQVTRFTERRMDSAVSLPFGALRVSEKFLDVRSRRRRSRFGAFAISSWRI